MNLKCRLGAHNWSKDCEKCSECGKTRSNFHTWKGFACVNCGHEQYSAAEMKQRVFRAAQNSDLETVNALLEHKPDLVSVRDNDGNTPLGIAAAEGHKEIAETLLSNAAEINSTNSKGFTPLHCAATLGRTELVRLLLTKKAEVNPRDKGGATPLHFAAFAGHKGAAELLLANGAEVNVTDKENVTPLIKAVLQGHRELVELLLAKGANVNAKDNKGYTSMHGAILGGHVGIVELLLAHHLEINTQDIESGWTPLHLAAGLGNKAAVILLLANKPDVSLKDKSGKTAFDHAQGKGHSEIGKLLWEQTNASSATDSDQRRDLRSNSNSARLRYDGLYWADTGEFVADGGKQKLFSYLRLYGDNAAAFATSPAGPKLDETTRNNIFKQIAWFCKARANFAGLFTLNGDAIELSVSNEAAGVDQGFQTCIASGRASADGDTITLTLRYPQAEGMYKDVWHEGEFTFKFHPMSFTTA